MINEIYDASNEGKQPNKNLIGVKNVFKFNSMISKLIMWQAYKIALDLAHTIIWHFYCLYCVHQETKATKY